MADARVHLTVVGRASRSTQMTIEDCIAELERAVTPPLPASYVEPCPDCAAGDCCWCDGKTLDHALDEFVPCPCRAAGHYPALET